MIFLSIVIPVYNCREKIIRLFSSIKKSRKVDFREMELVIVDDKSTDDSFAVTQQFLATNFAGPAAKDSQTSLQNHPDYIGAQGREASFGTPLSRHPLDYNRLLLSRIVALKKNSGPAHARNVGVRYAKGKVILFLDADVEVHKNTLFEVVNSFKTDKDLYALTGVWDKRQRNRRFFPKFKALRDWSYWINERDPKNYYYLFSTRVAAIKKDLFLRLGGFDTTYKAALIEDIELTYRIAKRYAVVFNPKVKVHHEFEDFAIVAKKYFWRSYYWSRIYRERKKFDPVATTGKEALTTISAGGVVVFSALALISYLSDLGNLGNLGNLRYFLLSTFYFLLIIHLWGVRKFLWFTFQQEGVIFTLKSFITGIILYIVILSGAFYSFIK